MSKKRGFTITSFQYAFDGIKEAVKNEPNFRIHLIIGLIAVGLGYFFKFSHTEWLILVFTITLVIILELINTAIETIVDVISPNYSKKAKVIKDLAAASVFIGSLAAIAIGVFLFLPKILSL